MKPAWVSAAESRMIEPLNPAFRCASCGLLERGKAKHAVHYFAHLCLAVLDMTFHYSPSK